MAQAGSRPAGASTPPAGQTESTAATAAVKSDSGRDDRVAELERENARLREQLAEAGQTADAKARPHTPSFTFSASMAAELEATGRTVSPFDGKRYVGTSADDAKEASLEEFNAAKPPARDDEKSDRKPAAGRKR